MAFKIQGVTPSEISKFWTEYRAIQDTAIGHFMALRGEEAVKQGLAASPINLGDILTHLPKSEKDAVMTSFRRHFNFAEALGEMELDQSGNATGVFKNLKEIGSPNGDNRVFRFMLDVSETNAAQNPLTDILNSLSVNVNQSELKRLVAEAAAGGNVDFSAAYKLSSNIMAEDYAKALGQFSSDNLLSANKVFVFDTETLGLVPGSSNVREISGYTMSGTGKGFTEPVETIQEFFQVNRAQTGIISQVDNAGKVSNKQLIEYLADLAEGSKIVDAGSGKGFTEALKPLLRQMEEADYVVGHNVQFDLNQILIGARKTGQYLDGTDQELVRLVDSLTSSMSSKVVDTVKLAQKYALPGGSLEGLSLAPELALRNEPRMFSLENLMLQTNAMDRLVEDFGGGDVGRKAVEDYLGQLHVASTDTKLEAKLLGYLIDDQGLSPRQLGSGSMDDAARLFENSMRTKFLRSYAPLPISNIADIRHVNPDIFEKMLQETVSGTESSVTLARYADKEATIFEALKLKQLQGEYAVTGARGEEVFRGTGSELFDLLRADAPVDKTGAALFAGLKVSPLEQEVFLNRNLAKSIGNATSDPIDMLMSMGTFRGVTGIDKPYKQFLNKVGSTFKRGANMSPGDFSQMKNALEANGLPFSNLSFPEMRLTNALSRGSASSQDLVRQFGGGIYEDVVNLSDDIGISHIGMTEKALVTRSGKIQMPLEILEKAGVYDSSEKTLFSLSPYSMNAEINGRVSEQKFVGLTYDVTDNQTKTLIEFLEKANETDVVIEATGTREAVTLRELLDLNRGQTKESLITALKSDDIINYGIQVGRLEGEAAVPYFDTVTEILGQESLRDSRRMRVSIGMLDTVETETGGRVGRFGQVIFNRFLDDAGQQAYHSGAEGSLNILKNIVTAVESATDSKNILAAATTAVAANNAQIGKTALEAMRVVKKATPFALIGAAVAGGAYYMYKRNREQGLYDETMEDQPTETSTDYASYRREMGMKPAPARRLPDPLITSYVVNNLDKRKIGHTNMGSKKNSDLFGGNL